MPKDNSSCPKMNKMHPTMNNKNTVQQTVNKAPRITNNANKSPQSRQTMKVPHQVHAMLHPILATLCSDMNNAQLIKTRKALTKFVDSVYERTTKWQKTLHQDKQNEDGMKSEQD